MKGKSYKNLVDEHFNDERVAIQAADNSELMTQLDS
jgi:hypothetical protein